MPPAVQLLDALACMDAVKTNEKRVQHKRVCVLICSSVPQGGRMRHQSGTQALHANVHCGEMSQSVSARGKSDKRYSGRLWRPMALLSGYRTRARIICEDVIVILYITKPNTVMLTRKS